MAETLTIGAPPITVELRRNARAKRMTLRVSSVDGGAKLTLPEKASMRAAKRFLEEQQGWLRQRVNTAPTRIPIRAGQTITLHGEQYLLESHSGARVILAPGKMFLPKARAAGPALERFIKTRAKNVITELAERDSKALGKPFGKISLRDPRSRWGSCNSESNLMFSWRLMLAPSHVLRYVVAHEIAHLAEMNHSAAFWAEVESLMPEYARPRAWLKQNGALLHRFDFKTP